MRQALHFGFMFQVSTLTSLFRDHIGVVLGGPLFGVQSVGYLNWAKNTTYYTSQIFTQVVSRVAFPSISRVQHDATAVRQMAQTLLKYVNLFTFPVIALFAALIPEFVTVFYTNKWLPALPAFYFYSVRMIGSNITTLYVSVLNAVGQVRKTLQILIWWTLADWVLALALCPKFGFTGIAMAYGLSVIPICVWLVVELNRVVRLDLSKSLFHPWASACWLQPSYGWSKGDLHLPGFPWYWTDSSRHRSLHPATDAAWKVTSSGMKAGYFWNPC